MPAAAFTLGATIAALLTALLAALIITRRAREEAERTAAQNTTLALALRPTPGSGVRAVGSPRFRRVPSNDGSIPEHTVESEILERYLADIRDALGADDVALWKRGEQDELVTAASASGTSSVEDFHTTPPAESLAHWALQQGMPASNYDTDDAFLVAAPVGTDGREHGAIAVYAADRRAISCERARTYLPRYGKRLAMVLDLLRDGRETRRYRGKSEVLARAAERIQESTDLSTLGRAICQASLEVSGASRAAFVVWNTQLPGAPRGDEPADEGGEGSGHIVTVSVGHAMSPGFEISRDSFVGTACREGQRFTIRESYRMSDFPVFGPGEPNRKVSSIAVVPLLRDGRSLGAIAVEGDQESQLTSVEGSLLLLLSSVASVGLESVRQLEEVTARAATDELTGLPNRRMFDERLKQHLAECDRFDQVLSLILCDVDHFKQVNDQHGHRSGDLVLAAIARALGHGIRNIDICARYGGEEFAILLPQTPVERARDVAERLRKTVEALRVPIDGGMISVTASFGVACYPTSGGGRESLFLTADRALYAAKDAGRNKVMIACGKEVVAAS
ncbi:MAG TPA: sensor domain-containing diguanylate cyclase [Gemmatimonadaceae bacterium]|nr:sensor domain-containing diguanylate cyclase [Gemmatimonadaceae bacterium]